MLGSGGGGGLISGVTVTALVHLRDEKGSGVNSGTFTSGAWRTRDLTTESLDTGSNCVLVANQFTLLKGTYNIRAYAQAQAVNGHQAKLRDVDGSADVLIGCSAQAHTADASSTLSWVIGQFVALVDTKYELQHRCVTSRSTDGFGALTSFGVAAAYAEIWLEKLAD